MESVKYVVQSNMFFMPCLLVLLLKKFGSWLRLSMDQTVTRISQWERSSTCVWRQWIYLPQVWLLPYTHGSFGFCGLAGTNCCSKTSLSRKHTRCWELSKLQNNGNLLFKSPKHPLVHLKTLKSLTPLPKKLLTSPVSTRMLLGMAHRGQAN